MALVNFLQQYVSSFLTALSEVFTFIGNTPFFLGILIVYFLFFDKENTYKLIAGYMLSFVLSSLALKNIIHRKRPNFVIEDPGGELRYETFSCPSFMLTNSSGVSTNLFYNLRSKDVKRRNVILILFFILLNFCIAFSRIYFMQNFLLDLLIGAVIGPIIYFIAFKFFTFSKWHLFGLTLPVVLLFCYLREWFLPTGYSTLFECCGIVSSFLIFYFLEEKFVKYTIKNNLIFTTLKVLITVSIFAIYYALTYYIVFRMQILKFLVYFVAGFLVFFLLPLLFKKLEKYCYIFSSKVDPKDVIFSSISLSLRDTKKISCKIKRYISKGDVIVLRGDLGVGKSVVARDILKAFGIEDKVTSPTFTLVNEYKVKDNHFYHFDMYRIKDEQELKNTGFDEIIDDKSAIKFVEWPENAPHSLPDKYKRVTIVRLSSNFRNIILEDIKEGK